MPTSRAERHKKALIRKPARHLRKPFVALPKCFVALQKSFVALQKCFAALQKCFVALQKCFAALQKSFSALQKCFAALQKSFSALQKSFAALQKCFAALQKSFASQHEVSVWWVLYLIPLLPCNTLSVQSGLITKHIEKHIFLPQMHRLPQKEHFSVYPRYLRHPRAIPKHPSPLTQVLSVASLVSNRTQSVCN